MNLDRDSIKSILKENSLRVTQSRLAVASVFLGEPDQFFTPEEVHEKVGISCDPVSVYRILHKFEEIGVIKKSSFHNQAARFSLRDSLEGHQHYFKCTGCHKIEPIKGCFVAKIEKDLAAGGYQNLTHHLEVTGLCPSCTL